MRLPSRRTDPEAPTFDECIMPWLEAPKASGRASAGDATVEHAVHEAPAALQKTLRFSHLGPIGVILLSACSQNLPRGVPMSRRKELDFSDRDLVREIRAGSSVAFERLMRRYERLVYRVAYGFTGDGESAMDVTQNTFLKVHLRLGSWRREGDLKNWIARIAANEAMNWTRSRRRHPTTAIDDEDLFLQPDPPQEGELRGREVREALHRSLSTLTPRHRLAVVLRYFQGMPTREISSVLQCSEATARNILFRSLQKLRSVLAESQEALQ